MNKLLKLTMSCLMLMLAFAGAVRAEDDKNVTLSIMGGAAIPTSDGALIGGVFGRNLKASPLGKASIMVQASPVLALGVEMGYAWKHDADINGMFVSYRRKTLQVTPQVEIGKWMGRIKPYMTFGGGFYNVHEDFSFIGLGTVTDSTDMGGVNGGVGLLAQLTENIAIGPDVRYHRLLTNEDDYHYVDTTLRLALRF